MVHSHLNESYKHTFENSAKIVEILFGEPIAHKSDIFSLELDLSPCITNHVYSAGSNSQLHPSKVKDVEDSN